MLITLHRNDIYKFNGYFPSGECGSATCLVDCDTVMPVRESLITHAGCIATVVGKAFSHICLFVHSVKGKRL